MKQYLLSIYQPDGPTPPKEFLEPIMRNLAVLNDDLRRAGAWVFAAGLHPPDTATVVRASARSGDAELLVTDGPFTEGKEHIGGFHIIKAADLDAALEWGRKLARALTLDGRTSLPIEVRPFHEGGGDK
jgi:hypothetical protein